MPRRVARAVLGVLFLLPVLAAGPAQAAVPQMVNIYLVALEDNGQSGMAFGCGDSLIPVRQQIDADNTNEARIRAALERLFSLHDPFFGESGLYTVFYQSNLAVQSVTISNGHALVRLTGMMRIGGVCDDPRAEQQMRQTILQFPGVNSTAVLLNGELLFEPIQRERSFPETGHSVYGRFLEVWEATGGLPVYGYPLTERIQENGFTVQYFERYRFELHPENARPYDVLFGLLGHDAAARRGLLNTAPFQPVQAANDANCTYFPETRHRLCFGFRAYWQSHGREFGDPGVTLRESLLLYGYPISEEFVDPQSGLNTQYFERAVFQWQPQNQPPWDILLQRLAAEQIGR